MRDPASYGLKRCSRAALRGGNPKQNVRDLRRVFAGERNAHRDALLLGAALGLELTERVDEPRKGIERASALLDDGRAADFLEQLARWGRNFSHLETDEERGFSRADGP